MTPVYKLSASSITGRTTYGSMLAGNPTYFNIADRAVFMGGAGSSYYTGIEYINIASASNAQDFGDIIETRSDWNGCSSSTRGCAAGGR